MPNLAGTLLFERIPAVALVLERDGTVVAVNPAGCTALGRAATELVGLQIADVFRNGNQIVLAPGRVHDLEFEVAGLHHTLQCAVSIVDERGTPRLHVFGIDVGPRTRTDAEESPSASQRLESLGTVAGGIAHEFNNLLVGVLAEASVAREDRTLPAATREALQRIETGAHRMAQLTRLMLAYAGRGRFMAVQVDPDELIAELREPLERMVGAGGQLAIEGGVGGVVIEADVQMLREVVLDLVANASEAGARRVTLATRIVLRQSSPWWQLEVSDDGAGMDMKTIPRIFEPFFTTKPEHHGLGLSAVQGIVRRLGGDIEADSTPGQGTRFRVRIPIVAGAPVPPRRVTETLAPIAMLADVKVLVADDEPTVRATVRRLLERRGASVVLAADGIEAEARLRAETFGLVILDVMMPGRGGYEVLPTARSTHPGVPVVLMSGYTNAAQAEGADEPEAFLEKPFTARAMDAAIDAVLRRER